MKTMQDYVIKKKNIAYWSIGDRGYTMYLEHAKRFTREEAREITNRPNSDKTMHRYEDELAQQGSGLY